MPYFRGRWHDRHPLLGPGPTRVHRRKQAAKATILCPCCCERLDWSPELARLYREYRLGLQPVDAFMKIPTA